ncbi:MAG: sulfotransferase [Xanthomonadales bacterium]|jgi:tetratricopeptide (TPR) repeat protein|nr:sulfotransferase [Xanthomonadales bacterium]
MSDTLGQACTRLAAGDVDDAESLLRDAGADPACIILLRDLLVAEGRNEEAADLAREPVAEHPFLDRTNRSLLALLGGDAESARREAEAALDQDSLPDPHRASALNHLGRALFNAGQAPRALDAFERAARLDTGSAFPWVSLGHAQRGLGNLPAAMEAYGRALDLCPGLSAARHDLGITHYHADRPVDALATFDVLLSAAPDHTGALADSAQTLMLLGRLEEAEGRLERALEIEPGFALAHLYLGQLHNERTDTEKALIHLRRAVDLEPGDVEAWIELTGVLEQANRETEAIEALRGGFAADPHHPGLHLEGARLERRRNDPAAAVRRLRGIDPRGLPPRLEQQYWFELGLNLDRNNQPGAAVQAFERGNALARRSVRSRATDPDALEQRCRRLDTWIDSGLPGSRTGAPVNGRGARRCFLVGFPRSGTTLVDTTLATNPQAEAIEEAPTLDGIIRELERSDPPYPATLASLDARQEQALFEAYETRVAALLGHNPTGWVIDKMPLRFLHAGLIQRLLPEARLVFVARHPCDVVLSNFMQQYAVNETNIHFDTLEHSVETYVRLMGLWLRLERAIDLPVTTVRYEDLVENMAQAIAPVCDALDLDAASLSFEREARLATRDRVRTSSYQQVAEPIYTRASGRWRRYESHLAPWLPALAPFMERYGYGRERT